MEKMEKRFDLQEEAEKGLIKIIDDIISPTIDSSEVLKELKDIGCIRITPPEDPPFLMHCLTFSSLNNYENGNSYKFGNIKINIRKLIDTIPGIIEATISISYDIPILKICAALSLWKSIKNVFTVEITREQAITLIALWKNCDSSHHINLDTGYECVNNLYATLGEDEISSTLYNRTIDQLIELKCIDITNNTIWLCEWVSKKYR